MLHLLTDKDRPQLQYYVSENIHSDAVVAVFTTRHGGVSGVLPGTEHLSSLNLQYNAEGEDDNNVLRNYEIITASLGFNACDVYTVNQKHTDNVVVINDDFTKGNRVSSDIHADAMVTNICGILLSVRTADCVPVLMFDPINKAVAAIHSGWRGTFEQICIKALNTMSQVYGTSPADIKAAIGPAIGCCCYNVGEDLYSNFKKKYGQQIDKYFSRRVTQADSLADNIQKSELLYCDLTAMNNDFLIEAGVPKHNIETANMCTLCNKDMFFSHRHSGTKRGTMASFIGIKKHS